jgi:hypothetical protein
MAALELRRAVSGVQKDGVGDGEATCGEGCGWRAGERSQDGTPGVRVAKPPLAATKEPQ